MRNFKDLTSTTSLETIIMWDWIWIDSEDGEDYGNDESVQHSDV